MKKAFDIEKIIESFEPFGELKLIGRGLNPCPYCEGWTTGEVCSDCRARLGAFERMFEGVNQICEYEGFYGC